jgi:thioredoxin-dependent peroxiredoxin
LPDYAVYHQTIFSPPFAMAQALARFSTQVCAGEFPVASASESLVNAFEVNDGAMFNTRTTYVVDPSGKIVFVHDDQDYSGHVKRVLAFLQGANRP